MGERGRGTERLKIDFSCKCACNHNFDRVRLHGSSSIGLCMAKVMVQKPYTTHNYIIKLLLALIA